MFITGQTIAVIVVSGIFASVIAGAVARAVPVGVGDKKLASNSIGIACKSTDPHGGLKGIAEALQDD